MRSGQKRSKNKAVVKSGDSEKPANTMNARPAMRFVVLNFATGKFGIEEFFRAM
jgi:hypothetical protein